MLLIGSFALQWQNIRLPRVKKSDIDIVGTEDEFNSVVERLGSDVERLKETRHGRAIFRNHLSPIEFEIVKPGSSGERLLELVEEHRLAEPRQMSLTGPLLVAHPSVVYALKMSHRYLRNSPHFHKTMDDIHALRKMGCDIPLALQGDWMKQRMQETYYYKHPSLAQTKANFFNGDDVPYQYDHDTIHEAVKTFARPAFEYIKKDTAEVYCSKEKFNSVSEAIRLATVLEESYVLALERHQIPNDFKPNPRRSFEIALMKVCTSIASGWWREYAWEHYHDATALYGDHYVERFQLALSKGIIKPYREAA